MCEHALIRRFWLILIREVSSSVRPSGKVIDVSALEAVISAIQWQPVIRRPKRCHSDPINLGKQIYPSGTVNSVWLHPFLTDHVTRLPNRKISVSGSRD